MRCDTLRFVVPKSSRTGRAPGVQEQPEVSNASWEAVVTQCLRRIQPRASIYQYLRRRMVKEKAIRDRVTSRVHKNTASSSARQPRQEELASARWEVSL